MSDIVEQGQSALRDLYGLVPEKDRRFADDPLRVLEHVLNAYADMRNRLRQIDAAVFHANEYTKVKLQEIERINNA